MPKPSRFVDAQRNQLVDKIEQKHAAAASSLQQVRTNLLEGKAYHEAYVATLDLVNSVEDQEEAASYTTDFVQKVADRWTAAKSDLAISLGVLAAGIGLDVADLLIEIGDAAGTPVIKPPAE